MELKVDGKIVFAATGGRPFDADQPTVIFLHGAGGDHTVWQLQTRYFAYHGNNVLALDLPGHGRSAGPALTAVGDLADWVGRLMDAAGVETAALVGHSLGGLTALEAAGRRPDRVRALALLGIAERMGVHPELLAAADKGEHLAYDLITTWGYDRRAQIGGHRVPGLWMSGGSLRLLERGVAGSLAHDLAACNVYDGALDAAGKVTCPVLLVMGDGDRMAPPRGVGPLVETIADARTSTIEDCGHMMMIEKPDQTLDALRQVI